MIFQCNCKNETQDRLYGSGKRVHNPCKKEGKTVGYRCTVCGNVKDDKGDETAKKKG